MGCKLENSVVQYYTGGWLKERKLWQCVAVCCSVLQCVAFFTKEPYN